MHGKKDSAILHYCDVTEEYDSAGTPGRGIYYEACGFKPDLHDYENLKLTAEIIIKRFGGKIVFLAANAPEGHCNPDWEWNGRLWDIKCPESLNGLSKRLQHGIEQIEENPGGIIINLLSREFDLHNVWRTIHGRMKLSHRGYDVDVMVIMGGKVKVIYRYKKQVGSPAAAAISAVKREARDLSCFHLNSSS